MLDFLVLGSVSFFLFLHLCDVMLMYCQSKLFFSSFACSTPLKPEGAAVVTALLRIQENNRGMYHLIISQKYALIYQPIKKFP